MTRCESAPRCAVLFHTLELPPLWAEDEPGMPASAYFGLGPDLLPGTPGTLL
jgi:hypothetical protein